MENRNGLAVAATLTHATGTAEREATLVMLARRKGRNPITLGADKACDVTGFVSDLRARAVTLRDLHANPFRGLRGPTGATVPAICSKPKSFTTIEDNRLPSNASTRPARGKRCARSNGKPSNGSTGMTTPCRFTRTDGVHPLDLLDPIGYVPPAEAEEACLMQT